MITRHQYWIHCFFSFFFFFTKCIFRSHNIKSECNYLSIQNPGSPPNRVPISGEPTSSSRLFGELSKPCKVPATPIKTPLRSFGFSSTPTKPLDQSPVGKSTSDWNSIGSLVLYMLSKICLYLHCNTLKLNPTLIKIVIWILSPSFCSNERLNCTRLFSNWNSLIETLFCDII